MKRILASILLSTFAAASVLAGVPARAVILRVQFKDVQFVIDEAEAAALADSASAYFSEQLDSPVKFELGPVVTLKQDLSYYGRNSSTRRDEFIYKAVMEACLESDDALDFSHYDADADGHVDNVLLLTAGQSEAEGAGDDFIWPQMNYLSEWSTAFALDGKRIDCFSITTETAGLRILCHEYAHSLGLMDLYDTDGNASGGTAHGLWGSLSLMERGDIKRSSLPQNFSAVELDHLGLGTCIPLEAGRYTLKPIGRGRKYLKLPSDIEGECFLFECREQAGWDAGTACSGLVVYHVDKSANDAGYSNYYKKNLTAAERWYYNQVNCRPDAECASVVPANPIASGVSEVSFPQAGIDRLDTGSNEAFRWRSGAAVPFLLADISSNADGSVSFQAIKPLDILDTDVYQDAVILNWEPSEAIGKISGCEVAWCELSSDEWIRKDVHGYSFTIEGLKPDTGYKAAVSVTAADGHVYSATVSFSTRQYRPGSRPFICLPDSQRNPDGSFKPSARLPLRVSNAPDAVEVRWFSGAKRISAGEDGYYILNGDCTLKAEITNPDGSRDILVKEVTTR